MVEGKTFPLKKKSSQSNNFRPSIVKIPVINCDFDESLKLMPHENTGAGTTRHEMVHGGRMLPIIDHEF